MKRSKKNFRISGFLLGMVLALASSTSEGAIHHVKMWDEANCTKALGEFFFTDGSLEEMTLEIENGIQGISSFANVDGLTVDGRDFNVENSSSYTVDQLTKLVLSKVAGGSLHHVQLWDEANGTRLLGQFFVADDTAAEMRSVVSAEIQKISNFANTDGLTVDGRLYNIDNSSSYTVTQLTNHVLGRVAGGSFHHVKMWDNADGTKLLGEFFVSDDVLEAMESEIGSEIAKISSYANVDGITVDGTLYNVENASSYSIDRLTQLVLSKLAGGSLHHVQLWDEANGTRLLGEFFFADGSLSQMKAEIRAGASKVSSLANADGMTVDGILYNIENSSSYTLDQILNLVLSKVAGGQLHHVKLWDQADCSGLLGEFFFADTTLNGMRQEIRQSIEKVSSFGNVDGLTVDGRDFNVDNSSSYTVNQLVNLILSKLAG